MCCCVEPNINGQPGYRWNSDGTFGIHPVNPPHVEVEEEDKIIFDEPGRCGDIDSHSYHYRLVLSEGRGISLLVRHGGGEERISSLSNEYALLDALNKLDTNGRYWVINTLYHTHKDAMEQATNKECYRWQTAAAEKRIKTRKCPALKQVKVWIEEKKA